MGAEEVRLVHRSQEGDLAAFNSLVEAYQGRVFNLCLRLLGQHQAAEDASQEAFIAAYRHIGRFRGGSFRAWLLRIAANACYDELRRLRRQPTTSIDEAFDLPSSDPAAAPEATALRRELVRHIQAGLATLPPAQRLTVVLADAQGLSYEEIAQATRTSLGTVKSRLARGRARLRDYLQGQGELLPQQLRRVSEE